MKTETYNEYKARKAKEAEQHVIDLTEKFNNSLEPLSPAQLYLVQSIILGAGNLTEKQKEELILKINNLTVQKKKK